MFSCRLVMQAHWKSLMVYSDLKEVSCCCFTDRDWTFTHMPVSVCFCLSAKCAKLLSKIYLKRITRIQTGVRDITWVVFCSSEQLLFYLYSASLNRKYVKQYPKICSCVLRVFDKQPDHQCSVNHLLRSLHVVEKTCMCQRRTHLLAAASKKPCLWRLGVKQKRRILANGVFCWSESSQVTVGEQIISQIQASFRTLI